MLALAEFYALDEQRKAYETEAEFQRKKYRATELLMLFHANNPTNSP